ncbi:(2Fe-2S)-binding protein [Actinokineospora soli]
MSWVPVDVVGDPSWVSSQVALSRSRYRGASSRVLGTLWWYSASSVLVGPVAESVVAGGAVADTSTLSLFVTPDGRMLDARVGGACADPGVRLRGVLSAGIAAVAGVTGASSRALWAIATDSVGNRVLWAGGSSAHASAIAAAVGAELPVPRFVTVGGRVVVRRASCCLIYEVEGEGKCVSCPRQRPEVRAARLAGA